MKNKDEEQDDEGPSTLDTMFFMAKNSGSIIKIVSLLRKAFAMKDYKTTVSAALGAVTLALKVFGVEIPEPVTNGVLCVALFLVGKFAADAK